MEKNADTSVRRRSELHSKNGSVPANRARFFSPIETANSKFRWDSFPAHIWAYGHSKTCVRIKSVEVYSK